MQKVKISFAIPLKLKDDLIHRVIEDGYGLRGKSRWVSEAIASLLAIDNFAEYVNYNDQMELTEKNIQTITINYEIKLKLEEAVIKVRQQYPAMEGVKGRIARTAILQRLLRSKSSGHRICG